MRGPYSIPSAVNYNCFGFFSTDSTTSYFVVDASDFPDLLRVHLLLMPMASFARAAVTVVACAFIVVVTFPTATAKMSWT